MHPHSASPRIPRLPILSWRYFIDRKASSLPSVIDAGHILPTTSGRAAIALALRALQCGNGDRVLVPTYHCPTMVAPIAAVGGTPVFYPIDAQGAARLDWLPPEALQGVKAAIVPHYFGIPRAMRQVREFCAAHRIALIEDCAHAFFGRVEGRPVGSWGDFAIASLTKFFPVSEGGCLIASRSALASMTLGRRRPAVSLKVVADALEMSVRHNRMMGLNLALGLVYGAKHRLKGSAGTPPVDTGSPKLALAEAARRARVDFAPDALPFQNIARAAWSLVRLGGKGRIVASRRANYAWLAQRLSGLKGARPLQSDPGPDAAPYVFPLWVDAADAVYQAVRQSGVPVFRWDDRWPETPSLKDDTGEQWATHVFQIGCHQDLERSELAWIADTLERLIEGPHP